MLGVYRSLEAAFAVLELELAFADSVTDLRDTPMIFRVESVGAGTGSPRRPMNTQE